MKTALITGATSGIGEAAERAFAGAGWRMIATGRCADRLDALPEALRGIDLLVHHQAASNSLYDGASPMNGDDIAATLLRVAGLPSHLNVNRLEIMPVSQSFAGLQVVRTQ